MIRRLRCGRVWFRVVCLFMVNGIGVWRLWLVRGLFGLMCGRWLILVRFPWRRMIVVGLVKSVTFRMVWWWCVRCRVVWLRSCRRDCCVWIRRLRCVGTIMVVCFGWISCPLVFVLMLTVPFRVVLVLICSCVPLWLLGSNLIPW